MLDLELSLNKNEPVRESAGNAVACIAFSTEYATDFAITSNSIQLTIVTAPQSGKALN